MCGTKRSLTLHKNHDNDAIYKLNETKQISQDTTEGIKIS